MMRAADGSMSAFEGAASIEPNLRFVTDVAVSADGAIAIADAGGLIHLSRQRIDGMREWIRHGAGALDRPVSVAFRNRDLLVSDAARGEIVVLGEGGAVQARLGAGVVREPAGIAVARDGTVFVADRLSDCLWRFDAAPDGGFVAPPVRLGESGANPGQFSAPRDIALLETDSRTCLLVADELNHRIHVVGPDGSFEGFFGMHALIPRQGDGRIHYPVGLAIGPDGRTLAIAEAFEDRVQLLELTSQPPEPDPALGTLTEVSSHFGAESTGRGSLFLAVDVETDSIVVFAAERTPPIHIATIGGSGASPGRFGEISALGIELDRPRVWVADRTRGRIDCFDIVRDLEAPLGLDMFLPKLAKSFDAGALRSRIVPPAGAGEPRMPEIVDIAFARNAAGGQEVLLLDRGNRALLRGPIDLRRLELEPLPAGSEGVLFPEELSLSDEATYITDSIGGALFRRDSSGAWSRIVEIGGVGFVRPSGVALLEDGTLVVADSARDGLLVVAGDGSVRVVGERGVLDEQFYQPESLSPTSAGWMVIDRGNHRFQRFTSSSRGAFQWNMTGGLGRWFDRKRRGSPGAVPPAASGGEA